MNRCAFGLRNVVYEQELNASVHTAKIVGQLALFGDREGHSS